ncbi:putative zinc protease AlbF [bacterium BMS3Abin03]|nr:putative zinc protease AlbF [bacterium BMS3Abin03]
MKKLFTGICIILILASVSIYPDKKTNNDGDVQLLPKGVYILQLDNGLKVLLIENPALPMVGINVVVKVGSAYETFATSGMSHMLEHLLFNGTDSLTQKELYDATDRIGGYNNANTGEYYTNYMMVTPAENIYEGMKLQADMLFHSTMPGKKFEKEKGIVMEEIAKSLANPEEQAERNISSIIYKGHALSLPTLGTYATIKGMKRDDVYSFYKNFYVPNNMIMSVIGNFNSEDMIEKIKKVYGIISPGNINLHESPNWGTGFEQPKNNSKIAGETYHRFYKGTQTQVDLVYNLPGNLPSAFFELLDLSLSIKKDSLKNYLDEKYPGAISDISFSTRTNPVKKYLTVTIKFKNDSALINITDYFIDKMKKQNLSLAPEIITTEAVKTRTDFYKYIEKPHYFGIFNADEIAEYGIESIFESYTESGYFEAGKMLNGFSIVSEPAVIIQHSFVSNESTAGKKSIQINLFKNGAKKPVVIAKQNSISELLAIHYLIKNKAYYESKYGRNAAMIWHDTFGQRMESPENKKESINYGLTFTVNDNPYIPMDNIYLSPAFGYIRVEGLADDVSGAINYLNTQMLNFVPTNDEYEKASQKSQLWAMMRHENKAMKLFNDSYQKIIFKPKKYSYPSEELTYEKLLEFGKEYFNPQNMIISVVSPESIENINNDFYNFYKNDNVPLVDEPAYRREYKDITREYTVEDTVGGEQSYLFYGFITQVDEYDKPALKALSLLLGDKIIFDIREKQGLAYRMSAGINVIKDKALFYINMGTRPENVDNLIPQFPQFFTKEYAKSFNADELIKRVNMYLGRMMFRRLSSINQAYYLAHSYYFDGDIYADEESLAELKEVTIDDVKNVADKYLKVTYPVKVVIR